VHRQDEDTISEPARVGITVCVDAGRELFPVGSHVDPVPEQGVSPAVAILRHQWQPERANAVRQPIEDRARPGEVLTGR
jgi:hypothetical protein